jgi:dTDP-4-dehydrorhamnose reductase
VAPARDDLDLSDAESLRRGVRNAHPDIIVNAAAYTAVDQAEEEPERAEVINATVPGLLADEARRVGALLVHYSTDYVFDGTKRSPYAEADTPHPVNVYGRTKRRGEEAIEAVNGRHLILRTSWVYSHRRSNFLRTMLRLGQERTRLQVVDDQVGSPTWAGWIAEATAHLLARIQDGSSHRSALGVYHLSSEGATTWCDFARAIFDTFGVSDVQVDPISTEAYGAPAPRPAYSVLSTHKVVDAFGLSIPTWQEQLHAAWRTVETP